MILIACAHPRVRLPRHPCCPCIVHTLSLTSSTLPKCLVKSSTQAIRIRSGVSGLSAYTYAGAPAAPRAALIASLIAKNTLLASRSGGSPDVQPASQPARQLARQPASRSERGPKQHPLTDGFGRVDSAMVGGVFQQRHTQVSRHIVDAG
eukprot:COSAG01_NODE_14747_length_1415_cov_1.474924_2_plen_149_part_01